MKADQILPHIVALFLMGLVAIGYFSPIIFDGKSLKEGDNYQARGMQTEMRKYLEEEGELPLWTNQMFVGMPTYHITGSNGNNLVAETGRYTFRLNKSITTPHVMLFLMMIFCYIALVLLGVNFWIAGGLSIAYGLLVNNLILMDAGHSIKVHAMVYMAPLVASALIAFRGRYFLGAGIFAFFLAMQISANHIQITYYTFFGLGILWISKLIGAFMNGTRPQFAKATLALGIAAILGMASNTAKLWTTYEYSKETIRGKSNLASKKGQDGLDKSYIFNWSYGKFETLTLLVPHAMGGSSSVSWLADQNSNTRAAFNQVARNMKPEQQQQLTQFTVKYWGTQPFTAGPVYYGAVVLFLFVLGLLVVRGAEKWWLALTTLLLIILAWGDNFAWFNNFMVDYFPMYNKFRAVTMTLSVAQIFVFLLAAFALKGLVEFKALDYADAKPQQGLIAGLGLKGGVTRSNLVLAAAALTGGFCILLIIYSFMGSFRAERDQAILQQLPGLVAGLEADRAALFRSDAIKSLIFVLLSAGTLWAYANQKLSQTLAMLGIGALAFVDFMIVDRQYVNDDNFKESTEIQSAPPMTEADRLVLRDKDMHYRVFDLAKGSPFNSAMSAYYHKNVGGYHPAKLMIYQELVDRYFMDPAGNRLSQDLFGKHIHILQMLNTKYIIQDSKVAAELPQRPFGNAWFVDGIKKVETADEELEALATMDPQKEVVLQNKFAAMAEGVATTAGTEEYILLKSYHPDHMIYESNSSNTRFAVFSEAYYPPSKGWQVFIDGQPVDGGFAKVNYMLRGLKIPAGKHKIEMRFEPASHYTGETITLIASLLTLLVFFGSIGWSIKNGKPTKEVI